MTRPARTTWRERAERRRRLRAAARWWRTELAARTTKNQNQPTGARP